MSRILVVEDRESLREMLRQALEGEGWAVEAVRDGKTAIRRLGERRYLLVLTDLKLPDADGLEVLRASRERDPDLPVVVMTAYGTVEAAVAAMKDGAYDFLTKPVEIDHLLLLVKRIAGQRQLHFENLLLKEMFAEEIGLPRIIGADTGLREVIAATRKVAPTVATVLITGESGTGKELIARALHHLSDRRERPFVAVNCAAIPDTLLESELFGHEKGSFTGAVARRKGKFELADRGTIFLDEIGELSGSLQAKILRVLQEKSFERVGASETLDVDVRIVSATNLDLPVRVREGTFRQDLFFRLNVFPLHLPPLRQRKGDIPLLAEEFLRRFARDVKKPAGMHFSPQALEALQAHDWPGNIRELENCVERAVILSSGEEIPAALLNLGTPSSRAERPGAEEAFGSLVDLRGSLAEAAGRAANLAERIKIRQALGEAGGVRARAAEALQVSQKTLLAKLREHGLDAS